MLGARQVGKTTLAHALTADMNALYLDLEAVDDVVKLANAESYLSEHETQLVVLDEIQRYPNLFQSLRGLIDQGRRRGQAQRAVFTARFCVTCIVAAIV